MNRRDLLLAALAPEDFPPAMTVRGTRLVLNGTGRRLYSWLQVEVYRTALYLPQRSSDAAAIIAAPVPRLIEAHYKRAVPLDAVLAAWEVSLGRPLPPAFRGWLQAIDPGDVERQLFLPDGVLLQGPRRPEASIAGTAFMQRLLAAWIGAAAPTPALRQGLLGQLP